MVKYLPCVDVIAFVELDDDVIGASVVLGCDVVSVVEISVVVWGASVASCLTTPRI